MWTERAPNQPVRNAVAEFLSNGRATLRTVSRLCGVSRTKLAELINDNVRSAHIRSLQVENMQLKRELEFVRKNAAWLSAAQPRRYQLIRELSGEYEISFMCRCLGIFRSEYYRWASSSCSNRRQRDTELKSVIESIFEKSDGRYGHRRIHVELVERGERVSKKRVLRLMNELGLFPHVTKRFVVSGP